MVTSFSSKSELALNLSANYAAGNAGNGSSPQPAMVSCSGRA